MVVFFVKSNENTYPNVHGCHYNEKRDIPLIWCTDKLLDIV